MTTATTLNTSALDGLTSAALMEIDPGASPAALCRAYLMLDLRSGELTTRTEYNSDNGTPADEWHGHIVRFALPATVDASQLAEWADDNREPLQAVIDGYTSEWDGNNNKGRLTDEAQAALFDLQQSEFEAMPEPAGLWAACDWFEADPVTVSASTSDADLHEMATRLDAEAMADGVVLAGTERYLANRRADAQEV